jgi:hypothetical protein
MTQDTERVLPGDGQCSAHAALRQPFLMRIPGYVSQLLFAPAQKQVTYAVLLAAAKGLQGLQNQT